MSVIDKTRNDQRNNHDPEPFWVESLLVDHVDLKNNQVVIATFKKGAFLFGEAFMKVAEAIAGSSGIDLCIGTVADADFEYDKLKTTATINNIAVLANDKSAEGFLSATQTGIYNTTETVVLFLREDDANTISAGNVKINQLVSRFPV